jgi:hypothetical protein
VLHCKFDGLRLCVPKNDVAEGRGSGIVHVDYGIPGTCHGVDSPSDEVLSSWC